MSTWSGWVTDFLKVVDPLLELPNRTFMSAWASHDKPACKNSPITLSTAVAGSHRCGTTVTPVGRTQSYDTHAAAIHAWTIQINESFAKPIKAAINSGNPFQVSDRAPVVAALKHWGSPGFATWYQNASAGGGTGGSGTVAGHAPTIMGAWKQLQHSINKDLPHSVKQSRRMTEAALRDLKRARRVKH